MPVFNCCWLNPDGEHAFDRFLAQSKESSVLQTYAWARFKAHYGWRPYHVLVQRGSEPVAAVSLLVNQDAGGCSFAYSPRGPVLNWQRDWEAFLVLRDAIHQWGKQQGIAYWRLDPETTCATLINALPFAGFVPSGQGRFEGIQPRYVWRIPLYACESEQWKALHKGARRQIRRSQRQGVTTVLGGAELLDDLMSVLQLTEAHQGIRLRDRRYFNQLIRALWSYGYVQVAVARLQQRPLAGALVTRLGAVVWDLYAGCDRCIDVGASYALLYACLRHFALRGHRIYDLGGIAPGEVGGLSLFKSRFGGSPVQWVGEYRFDF